MALSFNFPIFSLLDECSIAFFLLIFSVRELKMKTIMLFLTSVIFVCRKVWDALTGDVLHSFEHKHIVRACAFSEVGSSSGHDDNSIEVN